MTYLDVLRESIIFADTNQRKKSMSIVSNGKLFYTAKEAARMFHVRERTLRNWRKLGLRYVKPAHRVYYAADDITEFIEQYKHDDTGKG